MRVATDTAAKFVGARGSAGARRHAVIGLLAPLLLALAGPAAQASPGPLAQPSPLERQHVRERDAAICEGATSVRAWLQAREGWPLHDMDQGLSDVLVAFYRDRRFRPAWICADGTLDRAIDLLAALRDADRHGLDPERYLTPQLRAPLAGRTQHELLRLDVVLSAVLHRYAQDVRHGLLRPDADDSDTLLPWSEPASARPLQDLARHWHLPTALAALAPPTEDYRGLVAALARYRAIARAGGWQPIGAGPTLEPGQKAPRIEALRRRLTVTGDLAPGASSAKAADLYDDSLSAAVRHFQARHGLEIDGRVGKGTQAALDLPVAERIQQIVANIERSRWDLERRPAARIEVNVPGYHLRVMADDEERLAMRVIVGQEDRPTPILRAEIKSIVLNPYWSVPKSIATKDILPAAQRNPAFLARQGYQIFGRGGAVMAPGSVNWAALSRDNFPFLLRQKPGASNALGQIMFDMPNRQSIFLHDTPKRGLFERTEWDFSSGCVRLEDPLQLAQYLLNGHRGWTDARLSKSIKSGRNRRVKLPAAMPVFLDYRTAWGTADGGLALRRDLYGRDGKLAEALRNAATAGTLTQVTAR